MLSMGEVLLKCDLAETYHIYVLDWETPPFPISFIADMAAGLSEDSRIKRKLINTKLTLNEALQAITLDKLSVLCWQRSRDGVKGRNYPTSLYRKLEGLEEKKKDELQSFSSKEDYEEWYKSKMR